MAVSTFWSPVFRVLGWNTRSTGEETGAPLLAGNAQFANLSGRLLGAHVVHAGLIVLAAFSISFLVPWNGPGSGSSGRGKLTCPTVWLL
ncbi:hypothetical protein [Egbenema bharatensis]|uniref:hypothetical protein n=1 Tax=Egbenema bharatensis TaxID=3463334 RepID=UPI003A87526F